jgi:hypothetical protein
MHSKRHCSPNMYTKTVLVNLDTRRPCLSRGKYFRVHLRSTVHLVHIEMKPSNMTQYINYSPLDMNALSSRTWYVIVHQKLCRHCPPRDERLVPSTRRKNLYFLSIVASFIFSSVAIGINYCNNVLVCTWPPVLKKIHFLSTKRLACSCLNKNYILPVQPEIFEA